MVWLAAYFILAVLTFIAVTLITTKTLKDWNFLFTIDVLTPSFPKILFSLFSGLCIGCIS